MNSNSTTSRSKKTAPKKPRKKVKSMEERIAALEAAVEDLKYWRVFRDREEW